MGITSKLFLVSLGIVALAACGLTVWLWPRLAGRGPRALAGRLGLLLTAQVAVLLTFAALGNAAFGFYTSWSDLFGATPQHYQLTDAGRVQPDANSAQFRGGPSPASASGPGTGAPSGQVVTTTLVGLRSGITAQIQVFLPPQYFGPGRPQRYFPAVVVDANANPDAAHITAGLLRSPNSHPAVIVVVNGVDGRNIPCTADQPGGTSGQLFWSQDLRTAIAARFRVRLNAASWGALSTGPDGDCAAALALEDAGRYSAGAVLGPWHRHGSPGTAADPAWWLRTYPAPPSRLLFANLGQPPSAVLGPVRPPLQVTTTADMNEYSAVDWLAQALQNGGGQP